MNVKDDLSSYMLYSLGSPFPNIVRYYLNKSENDTIRQDYFREINRLEAELRQLLLRRNMTIVELFDAISIEYVTVAELLVSI